VNKTEEYLDALLNNVSPERKAERERSRRRTSEDFIKDFESELGEGDLDDVFSDFEDDADVSLNGNKTEDTFFNDLEGIVNTAKEVSTESEPAEQMEDSLEINTLEDDSWTESQEQKEISQEEQELEDILSEIPSEEDILNLSQDSDVIQEDEDISSEEDASKEKKGKNSGQKKKGLFAKLSEALFGKDDENDSEEGKEKSKKKKSDSPKKEKKKKEKKPKKAKEKKPKQPKKPKEKKPKKPKEVDLSPPLPKIPVVLIFVMSFSVMVFVVLSSNLLGYSTSMTDAKAAYYSYDYVGAYEKLAGLTAKEQDAEFVEQVRLLALIQEKLVNGDGLYRAGQYTMALDSYICALGRYDVNYSQASEYQIAKEYEDLEKQIVIQLQETFDVTADSAREIYGLRDRTEYTCRVYELVKNAGYME
jgi:hypothetical protein